MPSITAYTQYETLAFCQSVASHGSESAAFEDISTTLNGNEFIRDNKSYDEARLTAAALRGLYQELLAEEKSVQGAPTVNGDNVPTNGANPRKRKLSPSPTPPDHERTSEQGLLQSLVDKLYARFREQAVKGIREEEEHYNRLQDEIARLEQEEVEESRAQAESDQVDKQSQSSTQVQTTAVDREARVPVVQTSPDSTTTVIPPSVDASQADPVAAPLATGTGTSPSQARIGPSQALLSDHPQQSASPALSPGTTLAEPVQSRALPPQLPQLSPGAFHRTLPIPSLQRPNYGPINPQHYQPGLHGQPVPVLSQYTGSPHMPPPTEYPPQKRGSSSSAQGRGSPVPGQLQPQPQQPYPGYSGYPQQAPWPHHPPPQQQYQAPPSQPQPYYMQSPGGRPPPQYQTPLHPSYATYPQSAPMHYQGQPMPPHPWPQPHSGQPYYGYHGSGNITPIPRSELRQTTSKGRSSTPWKRRPQPLIGVRPSSPARPEREVSPISDTESPTRAAKARKSPVKVAQRSDESETNLHGAAPPARGRQQASTTPSAFVGSRSQSIASFASDTPAGRRKKAGKSHKIKAEPPSTPAAIPSDTEQPSQRLTGRRGRPRGTTMTSKTESVTAGPVATSKRKRSLGPDSASPPRSVARQHLSTATTTISRLPEPPVGRQSSLLVSHDPSLVVISKTFYKTVLLLLNEINAHKLAGIFAKALSERDAPGYKDHVHKPQDLKSIRAAVSRGAKSTLIAIEAFEERASNATDGRDAAPQEKTPVQDSGEHTRSIDPFAGERALGNGVYLVKPSEDLLAPKGIVNSAQLEVELVRVFANAVMFNPLPSSERGFGGSLRLRRRGGDVTAQHMQGDHDQRAESSESGDSSSSEAGGIISDTREMFEDVMALVRKWREAEVERFGNVGEADLNVSTPIAGPSKIAAQGSGSGSFNASANPSLRHSESVENEDDGPSTPAASTLGNARKRRRVADT